MGWWWWFNHAAGTGKGLVFGSEPALWLLALVQTERAIISEPAHLIDGSGDGMNFRPPGSDVGGFVVCAGP